ncbi:MAG: hypothetical protein QOE85_699 [Actinomycetota bacterium]|nr:hypothetical protein [Actinomycetota bacterium]
MGEESDAMERGSGCETGEPLDIRWMKTLTRPGPGHAVASSLSDK